jgi:hypothetical protein
VKRGKLFPRGIDSERADSAPVEWEPPTDLRDRVSRFLSEGAVEAGTGIDGEPGHQELEAAPASPDEEQFELAEPPPVQRIEEPAPPDVPGAPDESSELWELAAQIGRKERSLEQLEADLAAREARLTQAAAELTAREGDLSAREALLERRSSQT